MCHTISADGYLETVSLAFHSCVYLGIKDHTGGNYGFFTGLDAIFIQNRSGIRRQFRKII